MPYGIEIFSFDLFGFTRRMPAAQPGPENDFTENPKSELRIDTAEKPVKSEECEQDSSPFWGMFPVL